MTYSEHELEFTFAKKKVGAMVRNIATEAVLATADLRTASDVGQSKRNRVRCSFAQFRGVNSGNVWMPD